MFKKIVCITLFAFLFNLAWEVPHSLLYKTTTEMSVNQYVPRILQASAGDIGMVLIIFLMISIFNKSLQWKITKKKNIMISIIFGIIISTSFELTAQAAHRFQYLSTMPLIPFTAIGITPILQMIVTPIISFWCAEKISA